MKHKITMTKGKAYALCVIFIMAIFLSMFVLVAVKDKDLSHIPVKPCLTALCSITGGFIGLKIADYGVKGKTFNADVYRMENMEDTDIKTGGEGG